MLLGVLSRSLPRTPHTVTMRPAAALLAASALAGVVAGPAAAQMSPAVPDSVAPVEITIDSTLLPQRTHESRFIGGGSLFYVQPVGDFARHVGGGLGYSLGAAWSADTMGVLGFRAEWQDVVYGYESVNDSSARNAIRTLDFGPTLTIPTGGVRPYVSASVGLAYTSTEGSVPCRRNCTYDEYGDPEDEGYSFLPRLTYSVGRAAGVLFRVAKATARSPAWWLDLRVSQRHNGETRYATNGTQDVVRGNTDYRVWHVGVSAGLR